MARAASQKEPDHGASAQPRTKRGRGGAPRATGAVARRDRPRASGQSHLIDPGVLPVPTCLARHACMGTCTYVPTSPRLKLASSRARHVDVRVRLVVMSGARREKRIHVRTHVRTRTCASGHLAGERRPLWQLVNAAKSVDSYVRSTYDMQRPGIRPCRKRRPPFRPRCDVTFKKVASLSIQLLSMWLYYMRDPLLSIPSVLLLPH